MTSPSYRVHSEVEAAVTSIPEHARQAGTPAASTRTDWKNTVLAGLANYIDAGSIVAGSVALAIWAKQFQRRLPWRRLTKPSAPHAGHERIAFVGGHRPRGRSRTAVRVPGPPWPGRAQITAPSR